VVSKDQDKIWDFFQNERPESFEASVPRLAFLARQVPRGASVLNIGVGAGIFEQIAAKSGLNIHALDPSERSIATLRESLGLGERPRSAAVKRSPSQWGSSMQS